METKKILDTYKRYLRTLNCSDADLFTNYQKIMDFIKENCEDAELDALICRDCIGKNLNQIRKRNLKIKDYCKGDWDALAAKKGCRLIDNIKKYDLYVDRSAYITNSRNFWELADKQNPYVQLFLYLSFADRLSMKRLFEVSMKELEEAARKAIKAEEESIADSEANERETIA